MRNKFLINCYNNVRLKSLKVQKVKKQNELYLVY